MRLLLGHRERARIALDPAEDVGQQQAERHLTCEEVRRVSGDVAIGNMRELGPRELLEIGSRQMLRRAWIKLAFLRPSRERNGNRFCGGNCGGTESSGNRHVVSVRNHCGPGRTRTCNQTVMSGRISIRFVDFAAILFGFSRLVVARSGRFWCEPVRSAGTTEGSNLPARSGSSPSALSADAS